ncbi:hypothetical protein CRUP_017495 [Coryphaenoides rupestris]|nr:hypothetical protein CRUP_017495 [Coryphaenoides rupestris]
MPVMVVNGPRPGAKRRCFLRSAPHSAASDYRKRRKSEPSGSHANHPSDQRRSAASPKPPDRRGDACAMYSPRESSPGPPKSRSHTPPPRPRPLQRHQPHAPGRQPGWQPLLVPGLRLPEAPPAGQSQAAAGGAGAGGVRDLERFGGPASLASPAPPRHRRGHARQACGRAAAMTCSTTATPAQATVPARSARRAWARCYVTVARPRVRGRAAPPLAPCPAPTAAGAHDSPGFLQLYRKMHHIDRATAAPLRGHPARCAPGILELERQPHLLRRHLFPWGGGPPSSSVDGGGGGEVPRAVVPTRILPSTSSSSRSPSPCPTWGRRGLVGHQQHREAPPPWGQQWRRATPQLPQAPLLCGVSAGGGPRQRQRHHQWQRRSTTSLSSPPPATDVVHPLRSPPEGQPRGEPEPATWARGGFAMARAVPRASGPTRSTRTASRTSAPLGSQRLRPVEGSSFCSESDLDHCSLTSSESLYGSSVRHHHLHHHGLHGGHHHHHHLLHHHQHHHHQPGHQSLGQSQGYQHRHLVSSCKGRCPASYTRFTTMLRHERERARQERQRPHPPLLLPQEEQQQQEGQRGRSGRPPTAQTSSQSQQAMAKLAFLVSPVPFRRKKGSPPSTRRSNGGGGGGGSGGRSSRPKSKEAIYEALDAALRDIYEHIQAERGQRRGSRAPDHGILRRMLAELLPDVPERSSSLGRGVGGGGSGGGRQRQQRCRLDGSSTTPAPSPGYPDGCAGGYGSTYRRDTSTSSSPRMQSPPPMMQSPRGQSPLSACYSHHHHHPHRHSPDAANNNNNDDGDDYGEERGNGNILCYSGGAYDDDILISTRTVHTVSKQGIFPVSYVDVLKHSPSRSPAHHVDPHGYPGNRTPGSAPSKRALRLQAITDEWLSLTLDTPTRVPGTPAPPTPPPLPPPPPPAPSAQRALRLQAITDEWLSLTLDTPTRGPGTPAPPTPPPLPAHHHHHYLPLLPQTPPPAPPRRGLTPPPPPWRASSGQSSPAFGRVMPEGNRSLVPLVAPPPPSPPPPPPPPTPQPSPYRAGSGRLFCTEMVKHPRLVEHPEVLPQRGWGGSGSSVAERGRESGKTADPYEQLLAMILDFVTGEEDDEKAPARRSPPERSPMYRPPGESHRKQPGKLDSAEPTTRTLKATPAAPVGQSTSAVRLQRHKPETIEPPMSVGWQRPVTPASAPPAPVEEAGRLPTLTEEGCIELFIQEEEEEEEEEGVGSDEDADAGCRRPETPRSPPPLFAPHANAAATATAIATTTTTTTTPPAPSSSPASVTSDNRDTINALLLPLPLALHLLSFSTTIDRSPPYHATTTRAPPPPVSHHRARPRTSPPSPPFSISSLSSALLSSSSSSPFSPFTFSFHSLSLSISSSYSSLIITPPRQQEPRSASLKSVHTRHALVGGKPPVAPSSPGGPHRPWLEVEGFRALYNYLPRNEDELELREGDVVDVMEKCDDGWFVGKGRARPPSTFARRRRRI